MSNGGFTPEEQEVMEAIVTAWNKFVKLQEPQPGGMEEFAAAIHQLQGIMAIRPLRRLYPDYWPTYSKQRDSEEILSSIIRQDKELMNLYLTDATFHGAIDAATIEKMGSMDALVMALKYGYKAKQETDRKLTDQVVRYGYREGDDQPCRDQNRKAEP